MNKLIGIVSVVETLHATSRHATTLPATASRIYFNVPFAGLHPALCWAALSGLGSESPQIEECFERLRGGTVTSQSLFVMTTSSIKALKGRPNIAQGEALCQKIIMVEFFELIP